MSSVTSSVSKSSCSEQAITGTKKHQVVTISLNEYEILEELISSNVLQQYLNDDVIDVASELGIEEDSV